LIVIIIGYIAGILNKIFYHYDAVVYLYVLNLVMVGADLLLYFHNNTISNEKSNSELAL
jgi:predicted tellurium resistance membrane protein TerC